MLQTYDFWREVLVNSRGNMLHDIQKCPSCGSQMGAKLCYEKRFPIILYMCSECVYCDDIHNFEKGKMQSKVRHNHGKHKTEGTEKSFKDYFSSIGEWVAGRIGREDLRKIP